MPTLYQHKPHDYEPQNANETHQAERRKPGEQPGWRGVVARVNEWIAVKLTLVVGTMYCAYVFLVLALSGFPGPHATSAQYVQWFSQTVLQLVFLPVLAVGTAVLSRHSQHLAEAMYNGIRRLLHELLEIVKHLSAQDDHLLALEQRVATLEEINRQTLALLEQLVTQATHARPARNPKSGRYQPHPQVHPEHPEHLDTTAAVEEV